jgi:hypothetical protein
MSLAAPAVRAALAAAIQAAVGAGVLVSDGHPGKAIADDDVIAVWHISGDIEDVALGARRQEERIEVDVTFSVYRGGGREAQAVANDRAFALLELVRAALSPAAGDPTLGGSCRYARVIRYALAESDDLGEVAVGRVAELTAVVAIESRIT